MFRIKIAALAIFIVFCLGWLFTGSIHPHLLAPWKRPMETPKNVPKELVPAVPVKPPGTTPQA